MSEMRTLDRSSPEFDAYLRGTFSRTHRALPVKSLNVNTDRETVTFEIKPIAEIQRPSWAQVWLKAIGPRGFLVVLVPMFLVLAQSEIDGAMIDATAPLLSFLGVLSLFAALRLQNDFQDHLSGWDRLHPHRGSRAIQQGWVAAQTVRNAGRFFFALAVLLALPVLFLFPELIVLLVPAGILGAILSYAGARLPLWSRDLIPALLAGPLLVWGFEWVVSNTLTWDSLFLGVLWGWLSLFPVHLDRLEHLVVESPTGAGGWVTSLGFDRALRFINWWWLLGLTGFVGYHYMFQGLFWFWFFTLILVFISLRFAGKLRALKSPIGSQIALVRKRGQYLHLTLVALWVFETLWQVNL